MSYKIRNGIILKNVCNEWLLIAIGESADHCEYVRHINDTFAWYWQQIESGLSSDEIVKKAIEYFDAPESIIKKDIKELINQLYAMNYLLPQEETAV